MGERGPVSVSDLRVLLEHVADDIDQADEWLTAARHAVNDSALHAELRATGDDLADAWRSVRRAVVRLGDARGGL